MELVRPSRDLVASYAQALRRHWSPNTEQDVSQQQLAELATDTDGFLAGLDDRDPQGRTVLLPDGSQVPRLPAFTRWMWDGEFCGAINARWQHGTTALPPTCPGHLGYSVVPWKQRRGYATRALGLLLAELAVETDLPWVAVTTDPENVASQKVIEANGGVFTEAFTKHVASGGEPALRYRIVLQR
jgi:predicted acetyltransferase